VIHSYLTDLLEKARNYPFGVHMEVATAFIILQYHQSLNFEYQQYVYISASVYITTSWPQIVPSHQQISN
jgi:hypothetical protein